MAATFGAYIEKLQGDVDSDDAKGETYLRRGITLRRDAAKVRITAPKGKTLRYKISGVEGLQFGRFIDTKDRTLTQDQTLVEEAPYGYLARDNVLHNLTVSDWKESDTGDGKPYTPWDSFGDWWTKTFGGWGWLAAFAVVIIVAFIIWRFFISGHGSASAPALPAPPPVVVVTGGG